jgi:hypothetical protein
LICHQQSGGYKLNTDFVDYEQQATFEFRRRPVSIHEPAVKDPKPTQISPDMPNLLNTKIDYQISRTNFGTWKRYLYEGGMMYSEFTSHSSVAGWPLMQIAAGRSPETGRIATARGVIAIGQKARGFLAIGQAACGVFAFGQLAVGLVLGIGQAACGVIAVGQAAGGVFTIAQIGVGGWVGAQFGYGGNLWALLRKGF